MKDMVKFDSKLWDQLDEFGIVIWNGDGWNWNENKLIRLTEESKQLKEIRGLLGSINTEPDDDVRRLIAQNSVRAWAINELSLLIDMTDDPWKLEKKDLILEKSRPCSSKEIKK